MGPFVTGINIVLACALTLACGAAAAQTRRNVTVYGPGVYGQPGYSPPIPSTGEAPANLKYLSPRCASLNDAIRTAPARGLKWDTIADMRREYSRECADSESESRAKLNEDRSAQQKEKLEARNAEKAERDRASIQAQQCGESKRILLAKRARTDLTEGEKADLRRFEDNYRTRCG